MTYEQEHGIYGVIYCIKSPSGKMYVGQTTGFYRRMRDYKRGADEKHQPKLFHAIKKYGWENMKVELWCRCFDKQDLDSREKHLIKLFDLMKLGYNCREGGANGKMSEESKRKLSIANKGKTLSPEHKEALLSSVRGGKHPMLGKKLSQKRIEELRRSNTGRKHSPETIAKMREIHKKENLPPEILLKIKLGQLGEKSSQFKPEIFNFKNRLTGQTFSGHRVAAKRELRLSRAEVYNIIHCITNNQKGWYIEKQNL